MWTPRVFSDVEFVKFIRLVIFILDTKDTLLNIINDLCLKKKLENKKQKKKSARNKCHLCQIATASRTSLMVVNTKKKILKKEEQKNFTVPLNQRIGFVSSLLV